MEDRWVPPLFLQIDVEELVEAQQHAVVLVQHDECIEEKLIPLRRRERRHVHVTQLIKNVLKDLIPLPHSDGYHEIQLGRVIAKQCGDADARFPGNLLHAAILDADPGEMQKARFQQPLPPDRHIGGRALSTLVLQRPLRSC